MLSLVIVSIMRLFVSISWGKNYPRYGHGEVHRPQTSPGILAGKSTYPFFLFIAASEPGTRRFRHLSIAILHRTGKSDYQLLPEDCFL